MDKQIRLYKDEKVSFYFYKVFTNLIQLLLYFYGHKRVYILFNCLKFYKPSSQLITMNFYYEVTKTAGTKYILF